MMTMRMPSILLASTRIEEHNGSASLRTTKMGMISLWGTKMVLRMMTVDPSLHYMRDSF